jgi:hypothetical protein
LLRSATCLARRRLRLRRHGEINEPALFAAIEEMRATERDAVRLTRSARRDRARRSVAPGQAAAPPPITLTSTEPARTAASVPDHEETVAPPPFDVIEQW